MQCTFLTFKPCCAKSKSTSFHHADGSETLHQLIYTYMPYISRKSKGSEILAPWIILRTSHEFFGRLDFEVIYFFEKPSLKLTSSSMKLVKLVVGAKGLLFKGCFGYLQSVRVPGYLENKQKVQSGATFHHNQLRHRYIYI